MLQKMAAPAHAAHFKRPRAVVYPESDGKPLAETETHVLALLGLLALLRRYFDNRPDAYVAGNNFIFYKEGDAKARFSPDVYVVFGVDKKVRDSFFVWKEKQAPAVVFEFTSRKTQKEDATSKKNLCASLGVHEYFMCDPRKEYLKPALQGFRLVEGAYIAILPAADGRLFSRELNMLLSLEDYNIALYDAKTGERFLGAEESERLQIDLRRVETSRAQQAEERARAAEDAARQAETENAKLRAELEQLRKQLPH